MAESSPAPVDQVIFPAEAEAFVQELKPTSVKDVGSERWSKQRERLEKLNLQAIVNVTNQNDEYVKDYLLSHEKLVVVIHELLVLEAWRQNVFPLILSRYSSCAKTSLPAYIVLYHEASLVSLLEVAIYYREVCECVEDGLLDLADYCHRRVVELVSRQGEEKDNVEEVNKEEEEEDEEREHREGSRKQIVMELHEKQRTILFGIQVKAVAILRYLTDHISVIPLGVSTRLLNTYDLPVILVQLVEAPPWTKRLDTGELMKYDNAKWTPVEPADRLKLTKTEAQVWLALYQLLMNHDCQQKYEINQHNKQTLLKLTGYLNEPLLEQIPQLETLQRYLHHLSLMHPPPMKRDLILEQAPVLYESILKKCSGKWDDIARKHAITLLQPTTEQLQAQAQRWVDSYNFDVLGSIVDGTPKCANCGMEASKRCSRCRGEWYCGRECQVKHWKRHKLSCDMLVETKTKQ